MLLLDMLNEERLAADTTREVSHSQTLPRAGDDVLCRAVLLAAGISIVVGVGLAFVPRARRRVTEPLLALADAADIRLRARAARTCRE